MKGEGAIILLVVLAVIGAILALGAIFYFVVFVLNKHLKVMEKRHMAREQVVIDINEAVDESDVGASMITAPPDYSSSSPLIKCSVGDV